jgi:lipopolysaccharide export system protein LptC
MNRLPASSTFDQVSASGITPGGRDVRVFRRALRHSRHVRVMRIAIPVCLVVVVSGFMFSAWLDPMRLLSKIPTPLGDLSISGTKVTMEGPKLSGYTRDQRHYEVIAKSATQDLRKPDEVELHEIRAKLEMQDQSTLTLTAEYGVFDRKEGLLTLKRNIVLTTSSGVEARLSQAVIDTGRGDIVSEEPVEMKTQDATLSAKRMEVSNAGEVIRFLEGVTVNLDLSNTQLPNAQPAEPPVKP